MSGDMPSIHISIAQQTLQQRDAHGQLLREYPVSTAARGVGEQSGSFCTPRGAHIVRAKIGADQPLNMVFVGRRPTGEIWTPAQIGRAHV